MTKRFEVIISDNSIIYNAICENIECSDTISLMSNIDAPSFVLQCPKIDLLIYDLSSISSYLPLHQHKIKTVINLTNYVISANEIKLVKPIYLKEILHLLETSRIDNLLFAIINDKWIYNERISALLDGNNEIKLTENENAIIKEILLSKEYMVDKIHLEQKIWIHYEKADSNTIDVHLYNLKHKLPENLLNFDRYSARLNIINIY